jgi:hypothetical protein
MYYHRQLIAFGFNSQDVHSEVSCIKHFLKHHKQNLSIYVGKCLLVNIRFSSISTNMSRPCTQCSKFLKKYLYLFKNIYFTTDINHHYDHLNIELWNSYTFYINGKLRKYII